MDEMKTIYLIACACLIQACSGQPSDLKCSLLPCQMTPPATFTAQQQDAWHACMDRKRSVITTIPKEQRDYDACVAEAQAAKP